MSRPFNNCINLKLKFSKSLGWQLQCINQFLSSVSSRVFIVCPFPSHAPHTQVPRYSVALFSSWENYGHVVKQVVIHDFTNLIPSAFALPANEVHDHFLLAHQFGRTIRHVNGFKINDVQSLNFVTMVVSWLTFTIWCLCFGLLTTSERPLHCLYEGNFSEWLYYARILPKRFFTYYGERFISCYLSQILPSDFWNFPY